MRKMNKQFKTYAYYENSTGMMGGRWIRII